MSISSIQEEPLDYSKTNCPSDLSFETVAASAANSNENEEFHSSISGSEITTAQFGISPSKSAYKNRCNLQRFINYLKQNKLAGVIEEGVWKVDSRILLHDGLWLRGRGINTTLIEADASSWKTGPFRNVHYTLLHLDVTKKLHEKGVRLSDFGTVGADKHATDRGALIRLEGVNDYELARLRLEDSSSYGIYVTGYGVGSFKDDPQLPYWGNSHRGVISNCHALRGQIGIGIEGGAQDVLVIHNVCRNQSLHAFRFPSGNRIDIMFNKAFNSRNAFWIDRHKHINVIGNYAEKVETGCTIGGFNIDKDGEVSQSVLIQGNSFNSFKYGVSDSHQGTYKKYSRDVRIQGNTFCQGGIRLLHSRKVNIQSNTGSGGSTIRTSHGTTGIIGNNLMSLVEKADGVIDIGNNIDPEGMD